MLVFCRVPTYLVVLMIIKNAIFDERAILIGNLDVSPAGNVVSALLILAFLIIYNVAGEYVYYFIRYGACW